MKNDEAINEAKKRAWKILKRWQRDNYIDDASIPGLQEIIEKAVECGVQAAIGYRQATSNDRRLTR
jgi:hypothetical protein